MSGKAEDRPKSQVREARRIFKGKSYTFDVEDVTLPNGRKAVYSMIRHPGSTGIVPIMDDGTILMLSQYRHVIGRYILEIPSGTMEIGETPLQCARRELEEETGYRAEEIIKIGAVHIMPAYSDELIHVYLAKGLTPAEQHLDQDEIIETVRYPLDELMHFVDEGKITDGLTVLALHRAGTHLR